MKTEASIIVLEHSNVGAKKYKQNFPNAHFYQVSPRIKTKLAQQHLLTVSTEAFQIGLSSHKCGKKTTQTQIGQSTKKTLLRPLSTSSWTKQSWVTKTEVIVEHEHYDPSSRWQRTKYRRKRFVISRKITPGGVERNYLIAKDKTKLSTLISWFDRRTIYILIERHRFNEDAWTCKLAKL